MKNFFKQQKQINLIYIYIKIHKNFLLINKFHYYNYYYSLMRRNYILKTGFFIKFKQINISKNTFIFYNDEILKSLGDLVNFKYFKQ